MDRSIMKEKFYEQINRRPQKANSFQMSSTKYCKLIDDVKAAKSGTNKENRHYWLLKHYDVITVDKKEKLIVPQVKDQLLYYVVLEEVFDILYEIHASIGHGGRDRMRNELQKLYKNITVQDIQTFLNLCERCLQKRQCDKKGILDKPINFSHLKASCQVDLIDFHSQADGEFNYIMVYQDLLTKFVVLRALKSKEAIEVAAQLLSIFLLFEAPSVLQPNSGRDFVTNVIEELKNMWPELKIISGKHKSQGNQDIENMLNRWMQQKKCNNWSKGLGFVQFTKNKTLHAGIKKSPHQAMFGHPANIGLASSLLPRDIIQDVNTVEDLKIFLQEFQQNKFQVVDIQENKALQENVFLKEEVLEHVDTMEGANEVEELGNFCKICEVPIHFLNDTHVCELYSLQMKSNKEEPKDNLEIKAKRIKIISDF